MLLARTCLNVGVAAALVASAWRYWIDTAPPCVCAWRTRTNTYAAGFQGDTESRADWGAPGVAATKNATGSARTNKVMNRRMGSLPEAAGKPPTLFERNQSL